MLGFRVGCMQVAKSGDVFVIRLAIMDDTPRREFSPRHRHTLKEFAVRRMVTSLGVIAADGWYSKSRYGNWNYGRTRCVLLVQY